MSAQAKPRDPDFINAEIALKRAALKARERAWRAGHGVFIMQDGKIIEDRSYRPPEETEPKS